VEQLHRIQSATSFADASHTDLERRAQDLRDALDAKCDDNAVLAEHVSTLEGRIHSAQEAERRLQEEVRALRAELAEAQRCNQTSGHGSLLEHERDAALSDNVALRSELQSARDQLDATKQNLIDQSVQHTRTLAERDADRSESDAALLDLEEELVQTRQRAERAEAKMASRDVTEQSLAAQVTELARQLVDVTESASRVEEVCQGRIAELERMNSVLRTDADRMAYRLTAVNQSLEAMVAEQDAIVARAAEHEAAVLRGLGVQRKLVEDATSQTARMEQAKRERADMVAMLERHAADLDRGCELRRAMMDTVRRQDDEMRTAASQREELLVSVRRQKESLRALRESPELAAAAGPPVGVGGEHYAARAPPPAGLAPYAAPLTTTAPLPAHFGYAPSAADSDYKKELETLRQQREAALARTNLDIHALAGAYSDGGNGSAAGRGAVVQETAVNTPAVCPLSPARPSAAVQVPLPMSPYVGGSQQTMPISRPSPAPAAASEDQVNALEWAERALGQAAGEPTPPPVNEPIQATSPKPATLQKADASTQEDLPYTPSLKSMPSYGMIKSSFSRPPLPPLPSLPTVPTGDDSPYNLEGNFSEDQYGVPVESLTTEELIEEGQTALRQMPSLAGRDSPESVGGGSHDNSAEHSDLSGQGCLLQHATSLANDDDEEEEHVLFEDDNDNDDADEADDESALEREAKELESQLARINSQGSTIYGLVSMESNSILATPSYMSAEMHK